MSQPLRRISGYIPYLTIAFLNAFTDLGHKIIIQNTLFKHYVDPELRIYTAIVNALIAARDTEGDQGHYAKALPHGAPVKVMKRYGRLEH